MKKVTKITLLVLSYILVLFVGFMGSLWYVRENLIKANEMMNSSSIISRYLMLAQAQRALGKDEDYRESLLRVLKALDVARSPNDPLFTEKGYNIDKTLTYVRLSLVEKKMGNSQKSKEYMTKAMDTCRNIGWKKEDCSESRVLWFTERMDQHSIFSEKKDEKK